MEITAKFLGLTVNDNDTRYEYSYIPFTQSSKLVDEYGVLLAELKRFGWFSLNFKLLAEGNEYILKCRTLNNELITPEDGVFETNSSVNFSSNKKTITELRLGHDSRSGRYVTLEVFSEKHRAALIMASCLLTVRYLHSGGYS